jgi:hypothetical protein
MSTGLELIPLALAIGAVVAARRRSTASLPSTVTLTTRMRDETLLVTALDIVGQHYGEHDGMQYGSVEGTAVVFSRDPEGVYEAHFDKAISVSTSQSVITGLDEIYTRLVQQDVYQKLMDRAGMHGLALESERVEDDDSIVLTLVVGEEVRP